MTNQLWIEPVGNLLNVRVRGIPTEVPPVEVPISQWQLDKKIETVPLQRAIVVPNTRLAYLARLAFGEGNYRVFYYDLAAAVNWLSETTDTSPAN